MPNGGGPANSSGQPVPPAVQVCSRVQKRIPTSSETPYALLFTAQQVGAQYFGSRRHSHAAQPNILAAKALSLALAAASASLHAVKASRISFDFGSSLLAASRSALAAA